ncbi:hypothetical protein [Psychrobacter sp. ANT_WB68]|uniref:hypothetical protein n=1 Tax=Psychrobacter sp. ANT_WB68 TaxID=2597355 RepID=UPI0011F350EC|nr:hypothetical protein [Psychrobacter sp. ANT_WB68]KAA0915517.1 hypothetical protein FQ084_02920 [Psychrobacter sp. ANT_WB68]
MSTLSKPWLSLLKPSTLALSLIITFTLGLAGCNNISPMTDSTPTKPPASNTNQPPQGIVAQCPTFDPEKTMCTAQYDPVCVKTQVGSVISYQTAGNACSACSTPEAISYVKGECL